ncbi:M12 family metallopeptidase [Rhizohabitans arisaemae]|uniref:M12 family metallopeptidase n=1 Tax=Rhizohabitans arisaemae TaxID=2720610 RepID=UPI0024B0DF52|nr:M12 family metallopeptidase [Rhizohabitans arisaemae]
MAPTDDQSTDTSATDGVTGSGQYRIGPEVHVGLIQTVTQGPKAVQYTLVDGEPMVEGDIVLSLIGPEDLLQPVSGDSGVERGIVVTGNQFRWPNGVVPYDIEAALPNQARVTDAIAHWERNTRIRFVLRTAANAAQFPNFVRFGVGDGCSSPVGMRGNQQTIRLAAGCSTGSTIHEIGHSAGLWHEQSREDRNNWVTVNWANIQPASAHNFNQQINDGDDVGPYDYHSIMHYGRRGFAIDPNADTLTPVQNVEIGQREGLSPGDCAAIRSIYQGLEPAAVFRGVQFTGTVPANSTRRWFTHSWPAAWYVIWTVVPTAPIVDGEAQLEWTVQVTRQSGGLLKYFIAVRNLTAGQIGFEARYDVLGWSLAAT